MKKRWYSVIVICFAVLISLVIALLLANGLRRSSRITLPDATAQSSAAISQEPLENGVVKIEVTPETVQSAVRTLFRPESYVRNLTIETFWSGGSGSTSTRVSVSGDSSRADTVQPDGQIRHVILHGGRTYIWYDNDRAYYQGNTGAISADNEQHIPTYEDMLNLAPNQITVADYRTFSDEDCIYVETAEDENRYHLRYWVSVDSGLLIGAEKLQGDQVIYRMTAQPISGDKPATADFTLPDGKSLRNL